MVWGVGVADAVHPGGDGHRADEEQEHSGQRVNRQLRGAQGKDSRNVGAPPMSGEGGGAGRSAAGSGEGGEATHRTGAQSCR